MWGEGGGWYEKCGGGLETDRLDCWPLSGILPGGSASRSGPGAGLGLPEPNAGLIVETVGQEGSGDGRAMEVEKEDEGGSEE